MESLSVLLRALAARAPLLAADPGHTGALRLLAGHLEGWPQLSLDVYGRTLLVNDHRDPEGARGRDPQVAIDAALARLPWLTSVVVKTRRSPDVTLRRGVVLRGRPDRRVREHDVAYALDWTRSLDASLYLDTRALRLHLKQTSAGRDVLNTFAYTGSLGLAAAAGGARRVVQLDLEQDHLDLGKQSYAMNGLPVRRADFMVGDFFKRVAELRRAGEQFDTVIVDPPFFSSTRGGTVDLVRESHKVLNKVRPLLRDGGELIAINNALFVSGADWLAALAELCRDGYLELTGRIDVPLDSAGTPDTRVTPPPADPAPFAHSTKIALLRARKP